MGSFESGSFVNLRKSTGSPDPQFPGRSEERIFQAELAELSKQRAEGRGSFPALTRTHLRAPRADHSVALLGPGRRCYLPVGRMNPNWIRSAEGLWCCLSADWSQPLDPTLDLSASRVEKQTVGHRVESRRPGGRRGLDQDCGSGNRED